MRKNIVFYFIIFIFVFVCFGLALPAMAIEFTPPPFRDASYQAKFVSQSIADPISIEAGKTKDVIIRFKNVGKSAWYSTGKNFVSAYTVNPSYHSSLFAGAVWVNKNQPAKISGTVKSGEIGEIKIKLYAPKKTGDYKEYFYLAAENKTWIKSGYFYLKIKVVLNKTTDYGLQTTDRETANNLGNSAVGTQDEASEITKEYRANLVVFSSRSVTAAGGEKIHFIVRYRNNGTVGWNGVLWQEAGSLAISGSVASSSAKVSLADQSWLSPAKISLINTTTNPGAPLEISFDFRAPAGKGEYTARFQLLADGHTLDGGTLELPLTVTADAPVDYQPPVFTNTRVLISEPNIRVGLYKADEPVEFKSDFNYQVYAGGFLQGVLGPNELATIDYNQGVYSFKSANLNFNGSDYIRLAPESPNNYFSLVNYSRQVSWKGNKNFNVYRGVMEFKYSPKSDAPWVVNELPLDSYVAGVAETSNGAAMEYIKAVLTAARSYAYYHINNGIPKDQRTFDVYPTTADQLYLGYNSEVLMPRVAQAEQATYGEMVTYGGTPALTPYFGHSDGRTRSWTEVWGGADKPWLRSVEAKYDAGQSMWGHGVGMSAQDASQRADKDGWTYGQLLKYYYTGTEVEKIY